MGRSGLVVYLKTSVAQQLKRLSRDRSRPLLQTGDREGRLLRLAEERNPLYEEVADIVYVSQNRSPEAAAHRLAAQLRARREAGESDRAPEARGTARR